jgi:hypothetical protein
MFWNQKKKFGFGTKKMLAPEHKGSGSGTKSSSSGTKKFWLLNKKFSLANKKI